MTFFILLNALLAIIVDSYAHVKQHAAEESKIDPLRMFLQESFFQLVRPAVGEAAMSSNDLLAAVHDIYENAKPRKRIQNKYGC